MFARIAEQIWPLTGYRGMIQKSLSILLVCAIFGASATPASAESDAARAAAVRVPRKPAIITHKAEPAAQPPAAQSATGTQDAYFADLEKNYDLPQGYLHRLMMVESRGNTHLVSKAGARGPFQVMPGTARVLKIKNPEDVRESARGVSKYLKGLKDEFGDMTKASIAYNIGERGLRDHLNANNGTLVVSKLPKETQLHIAKLGYGPK